MVADWKLTEIHQLWTVTQHGTSGTWTQKQRECPVPNRQEDLPLAPASSEMIRWSRVLLSHTLDAARSY